MTRIPILVSRCLLGVPCRYHGRTPRGGKPGCPHGRIRQLLATGKYEVIDICPEVDAGMSTPRPPTRMIGDRLVCGGKDVTDVFLDGAELALVAAEESGAAKAYLLRGSPACDKGTGTAAFWLQAHGVTVIAV